MNFMLPCALFCLTIITSQASHVEYIDPPPTLHRTVHLISKIHAPIVKSVEHHVQEVPVPVPVPIAVERHVPVLPVAVEPLVPVEAVEPVVEECDPLLALLAKFKAHFLHKHLL